MASPTFPRSYQYTQTIVTAIVQAAPERYTVSERTMSCGNVRDTLGRADGSPTAQVLPSHMCDVQCCHCAYLSGNAAIRAALCCRSCNPLDRSVQPGGDADQVRRWKDKHTQRRSPTWRLFALAVWLAERHHAAGERSM